MVIAPVPYVVWQACTMHGGSTRDPLMSSDRSLVGKSCAPLGFRACLASSGCHLLYETWQYFLLASSNVNDMVRPGPFGPFTGCSKLLHQLESKKNQEGRMGVVQRRAAPVSFLLCSLCRVHQYERPVLRLSVDAVGSCRHLPAASCCWLPHLLQLASTAFLCRLAFVICEQQRYRKVQTSTGEAPSGLLRRQKKSLHALASFVSCLRLFMSLCSLEMYDISRLRW